jgi:outer membrane biosynthesis protein TonB
MTDEFKVRTTPALLAPFASIGRELGDIFRNPVAFLGGVFGTGLFAGGVVLMVLFGPKFEGRAEAAEDDVLDMEFMPGALVRKGEKIDPAAIPEKIIVEETVAASAPAETKITKDEQAIPNPEPKKNDKPKDTKATEAPDPNKKGAKESDKNREGNKQYDTDLPTVKDLPGDPFGSPNGWADMAKDGDPWATAVLGALNGMKVGAYAGQGKAATYKFQLVVCADGSVDRIKVTQPSGDAQLDGAIKNAVESLKLPKAPANIAKQLAGKCKRIPYDFTWSTKGGGGTVK